MSFLGGAFKEILFIVILVVGVIIPIRVFIAQPFVVEGESMFPTFKDGDYLIVDQFSYRVTEPDRGDVIVFRYPDDPKLFYIKRVIGLPGETVSVQKGNVVITGRNGEVITLEEPYVVAEDATYTLDATLGSEQYFVMGDNRPRSSDSRVWGPLPKENIMGRAFVRMFPPPSFGVWPGAYGFSE
jgi:signal peptidase I